MLLTTRVFTDGSAVRNGKRDAVGGLGVYFGPNDPRNRSQVLTHALVQEPVTSILAELLAIMTAVSLSPTDCSVVVYTDSEYSLKCLTTWHKAWRRAGWRKRDGKPPKHIDLIRCIIDMVESKGNITFHHVRSHTSAPPRDSDEYEVWFGNHEADRLATAACRNGA
jgi:ribonuclease HI